MRIGSYVASFLFVALGIASVLLTAATAVLGAGALALVVLVFAAGCVAVGIALAVVTRAIARDEALVRARRTSSSG